MRVVIPQEIADCRSRLSQGRAQRGQRSLNLSRVAVIYGAFLLVMGVAFASAIPAEAVSLSSVPRSSSACPLECGDAAAEWCEATFGRGGNVTVDHCGEDTSFQCVCNGVVSVQVKSTIVSDSQNASVCDWTDQRFESIPGGQYCTPTTGLCPASCSDIDTSYCETALQCTEDIETGVYNFSCTTCQGRVVTISGTEESCSKQYSPSILCDPATTCNGHGCCTRRTAGAYPVCTCFSNNTHGYWAQPTCDTCISGYESRKDCREPTSSANIVYVLSSIATTWTMLSPNLAVPVLFVILGLARRLWDSDRSFTLTSLRRANLAPVQTARRSQQSLFHSKYVPRRPAKSRCFLNEGPDSVRAGLVPRGPPAY